MDIASRNANRRRRTQWKMLWPSIYAFAFGFLSFSMAAPTFGYHNVSPWWDFPHAIIAAVVVGMVIAVIRHGSLIPRLISLFGALLSG